MEMEKLTERKWVHENINGLNDSLNLHQTKFCSLQVLFSRAITDGKAKKSKQERINWDSWLFCFLNPDITHNNWVLTLPWSTIHDSTMFRTEKRAISWGSNVSNLNDMNNYKEINRYHKYIISFTKIASHACFKTLNWKCSKR